MDIKFTGLEDVHGTKKDGSIWYAVRINGTKLDGGEQWKSVMMFTNDPENTEVIAKAKALQVGDKVNVMHAKKGRNNVVKDIVPLSASSDGGASTAKGSTGKWAPDPNKNRGVALSYAVEHVIPRLFSGQALIDMEIEEYMNHAFKIADFMNAYIEGRIDKGGADESAFKNADPLAPPQD